MKTSPPIVLALEKVTKAYLVERYKPTLVESFFRSGEEEQFLALNNVSVTIRRGEKIGILGLNGAGKTTLLKVLAGITQPNSGQVVRRGKLVSLINLYAGFHPELSGFENITLNGLLIGMSAQEIAAKKQQIIAFADIGDFMYAPMHTYSTGMRLRLGFSIAVHSDPDILLLDEGISAGDEQFHHKANRAIRSLFKTKTVIVVSHWMSFLRENCQKLIWMENGAIKKIGNRTLIDEYVATYAKQSKKV